MKTRLLSTVTYFILAVLLAVGITSCKRFLTIEPVSSFGTDYVFSNVVNAEKAVIGVYYRLTGDNGYGIRVSMYYPYDDDIMMGQGGTPFPDNERRDIAHFTLNANNTQLPAPFNQFYNGIERANICIYNIPRMTQYDNGTAQEKAALRRLHGEALTLRALFYQELIRNWGDVPAQFQPSSQETNLFKRRTDRDSIYDVLLEDLALAATLLPWRTEVSRNERITQGGARALRARIALFRGGWSLRQNGTMQRGSDHRKYYQIARDECAVIMNRPDQHRLNTSFESVFRDYVCGKQPDPFGEIIFEIGMGGANSALGDSKLGYYNGPRVNNNGNSALTVLPNYFYMFDSTDSRRDVMCAPYFVNATGTTITSRTGRGLELMLDGKFRRDWIPGALTLGPQWYGVNWPVVRFSDVLLMFAEAENELNNGPTPGARNALEQVRLRAYGGNASLIGTTPGTYNTFFDAIVRERALELGGEGIRKYDLIRWNLLGTKLAETRTILTAMSSRLAPYNQYPEYMLFQTNTLGPNWIISFYNPNPFGTGTPAGNTRVNWVRSNINTTILTFYAIGFTPGKSELLPLPQASLDANPNLVQNPNY
ncbi:MAG TPA: RagB/SusD family nutrient uptake outer membrane protein [Lacibacter sp.]|nr:RagB/SusD family nutrient uptake outer membrane protein [Lacibacter sp.]HMO89210.1 RagB/SusD family nutrient uptake outer membrane protein [Lacibacter sp.]HMP87029.1 RagB/SusD family nutrient uptake outer membrane protein [Lacibacter sp.]